MKPNRIDIRYLIASLVAMLIIALVFIAEAQGMRVNLNSNVSNKLLPQLSETEEGVKVNAATAAAPRWLLVTDPAMELSEYDDSVRAVLDITKTRYAETDASALEASIFTQYDVILYSTTRLVHLSGIVRELLDWIDGGGRIAFMLTPDIDEVFLSIYRKLGIVEYSYGMHAIAALNFDTDIIHGWQGRTYSEEGVHDNAQNIRLDEECITHISSNGVPILWERDVGAGRIVVSNHTLVGKKDMRGLLLMPLLLLEDEFIYPIINSGMVFVDDFPAPQPEGYDEWILDQFGMDTQAFFRNHWWPDMEALARQGVRYTGVLIETYTDKVEPPFTPETDHSLLRYYGTMLLNSGGEIGLHGYDHMPLCPIGFPYAGENYVCWPSIENMQLAINELTRYAAELFPEALYQTYVPPSNYLSDEGYQALLASVPGLRIISGVYLPEDGVNALVQEFTEDEHGIVCVPRITSGFDMDSYTEFCAAQQLLFQGVFSHFIHPDDVLDARRGALAGWDNMYSAFSETLSEVREQYPQLRWHTATSGAAAVQRYDRMDVRHSRAGTKLNISIVNFYDEAWLAMYLRSTPAAVEGGELYKVSSNMYWLHADSSKVSIEMGTAA